MGTGNKSETEFSKENQEDCEGKETEGSAVEEYTEIERALNQNAETEKEKEAAIEVNKEEATE